MEACAGQELATAGQSQEPLLRQFDREKQVDLPATENPQSTLSGLNASVRQHRGLLLRGPPMLPASLPKPGSAPAKAVTRAGARRLGAEAFSPSSAPQALPLSTAPIAAEFDATSIALITPTKQDIC